ncbi:MAG TPA: cytochrome c [Candidatus Binatia bacterium]|nr:cytochrome c [Candidatus Binatia bacterium]
MAKIARKVWVRGLCAAAILSVAGVAAVAQQDVLKTRQADMKANGEALKTIDGIIKAGGNPQDVVAPANKIAETAALIPSLFPAGSDQGDTGANKEIWDKFDDFKTKASNLENEAKMLAAAGQAGDLATVRAQFDKVVQACGDCHKPYRHKRQ